MDDLLIYDDCVEKPTVGDIIRILQAFPPNLPFVIGDSDEAWFNDVVFIEVTDKKVRFL